MTWEKSSDWDSSGEMENRVDGLHLKVSDLEIGTKLGKWSVSTAVDHTDRRIYCSEPGCFVDGKPTRYQRSRWTMALEVGRYDMAEFEQLADGRLEKMDPMEKTREQLRKSQKEDTGSGGKDTPQEGRSRIMVALIGLEPSWLVTGSWLDKKVWSCFDIRGG